MPLVESHLMNRFEVLKIEYWELAAVAVEQTIVRLSATLDYSVLLPYVSHHDSYG